MLKALVIRSINFKCLLAVVMAFASPAQWVRAQSVIPASNGNPGSRAIDGAGSSPGQAQPIIPKAKSPSSSNINQGARSGQGAEAIGAAANAAIGATLIATGRPLLSNKKTRPKGMMLIALGMTALAQAAATMGASKGSKGVGDATDIDFGAYGSEAFNANDSLDVATQKSMAEYQKLNVDKKLAELKEQGFMVDPKTGNVITPDGEFGAGSLSMASALEGLDGQTAAELKEKLDQTNAKYADRMKVISMDLDSGGGGGGGGSRSGRSFDIPDYSALLNGTVKERKPASVAGLQVMAGGEPIGVRADDIFQMVHRRYQSKRKSNLFIESPDVESKKSDQPSGSL